MINESCDTNAEESLASAPNNDCDDSDAGVYPGAPEVVTDGIDQNCDAVDACYQDTDADDYGSMTVVSSTDLFCNDPGSAYTGSDCNDTDDAIYPGAVEVCGDGTDNNCDGLAEEGCCSDAGDIDGYGDVDVGDLLLLQRHLLEQ